MKTHAVLFTGIDTVEIGEVSLPEPLADEVLIETAFTGVSPGTELRCLAGRQPDMGAWPVLPGYQATGRVLKAGREAAASFAEGTPVFHSGTQRLSGAGRLWGGHVAHAVVAARDVFPLDERASLADAALNRLAAIARHGVGLSKPMKNETVVVIGLGPIGLLSAQLHALDGARVVALDVSIERVKCARGIGIDAHLAGFDLVESVGMVAGDAVDIVADTTGMSRVMVEAVRALRPVRWGETALERARPRFLAQGSYPSDTLPTFPYYEAFAREAAILTPRDCEAADLDVTLALIASGRLQVGELYGRPRPVAQAAEVYDALRKRSAPASTAVFAW